ncbi:MAG: putative baseplate assembly protein [Phycisphaerales bacterium]
MSTVYCCKDPARREEVEQRKTLNGIDHLEVVDSDEPDLQEKQHVLRVSFINPPNAGLKGRFFAEKERNAPFVKISGGVRITHIVTEWATWVDNHLVVRVRPRGDFSTYTLHIVEPGTDQPLHELDPQLASVPFSFKVECPSQFDCQAKEVCPPVALAEPDIDYLAKDYASFRRLILDRLSAIMPDWRQRNPVDLGIAIVELLAYTGDYLSHRQDAVSTETYLGTARQRVSVRRHARLLDYRMHDGCNAKAWVCLTVNRDVERLAEDEPTPVPKTAKFLTTADPPPQDPQEYSAWLHRAQPVFEPVHEVHGLYQAHNRISFYTWSDRQCCLPKGATQATLLDNNDPDARLRLRVGDVLVFEEVCGRKSGPKANADPRRRRAVRLTCVDPQAIEQKNDHGVITRIPGPVKQDALTGQPIVEIAWDRRDEMPFPLCLSAMGKDEQGENTLEEIGVARGNVVLVDHGLTIADEPLVPDTAPESGRYRPHLKQTGLTFLGPLDATKPAAAIQGNARESLPVVKLTHAGGTWLPKSDLLSSDEFSRDFVVEMESDGVAHLRFGDGVFGRKPNPGVAFRATYRVGGSQAGNVGAETIRQVLHASGAIEQVRNPLPAQGGTAPESIEQVRQYAPQAFRRQERAVTEADYAEAARRYGGIQKAAARFRWTGSWYTVFVAIDRERGLEVDSAFRQEVRRHLENYRLTGYDVEIQGAEDLPLDVAMTVCVKPGYFRADVEEALLNAFSNRDLADTSRGFFHPDNFTFGQPVYLSALYQRAMSVAGVASVDVTRFHPWGRQADRELEDAVVKPSRFQIVCLDNDRNFPENGKLEFTMEGGL